MDVLYTTMYIWGQCMSKCRKVVSIFPYSYFHVLMCIQLLLICALSNVWKTAWKYSSFCRKKITSYWRATPTLSKKCSGYVPNGGKSSLPSRRTALFKGFPKTAMWSELHGGEGWYGKWGKWLLILKEDVDWMGQKPFHTCKWRAFPERLFPSLNMKQKVSCSC